MSVVVIGMDYPNNCEECKIKSWDIEGYVCPFSGVDTLSIGRQVNCPLRPMPEKYGRLIDADDMERFMSDTVQGDIRQYPYSDTLWDTAFKWIDSRPTIVEAEGE